MKSLVSILIPTFNRELLICEAIESALNQTYSNIEIIIVDNCSTDNTSEVIQTYIKKDSRIKYFKNSTNIGPVLNWKRCLELASGKFVKILWSDDLINKDFVEKTIALFSNSTAFVLSGYVISDLRSLNTLYESKFQYKNYTTQEYIKQLLIYSCIDFPVSPGSAIFRLEDIKNSLIVDIPNYDNLDSKLNGAGNDLLIMLNIARLKKYKHIKCVNSILANFRAHKDSFSISNNLDIYYEYARLYYINFHNDFQYMNLFNSRLYFKKLNNKSLVNLYEIQNKKNTFNELFKFSFLIEKIFYKIKFKVKY